MEKNIIFFLLIFLLKIWFSSNICIEGENFCTRCNPVTKLCEKCENEVFKINSNGICVGINKCIKGNNYCLKCDSFLNLCEVCEEDYYPDENGGCTYSENCEISYKGMCLKCNSDFILVGKNIKFCLSKYSENLKNCENVDPEKGFCTSCKEGFFLNKGDNRCIDIPYCQESIFGVCKKCIVNYYFNVKENKCLEQKDKFINCKETLDGINCEICEDDFYFDEENNCIACNYCAKGYYYRCDKCIEGYYLSEDKYSCTKDMNCYSGDKDYGLCTKCKEGFYLDIKNDKCESNKEENNFKYCHSSYNDFCYKCIYNAFLGKDNKCSFSQNCSESENNTCVECIKNYHLDINNKCTNITKCTILDDEYNCIECEEGYFYNNSAKICEKEKKNFENCKISDENGEICGMCRDDFYYNKSDHLCYSNKEQGKFYKCQYTFNDGEYCIRCVKDYYLGFLDHKCTKIEGCYISESENKCIYCDSENYCLDVKSGKCVYNNKIISEEKKYYYKCNMTNNEGTACENCVEGFILNEKGLCYNDVYCLVKDDNGICINCTLHDYNYNFLCLNKDFGCVENYYGNCLECNNNNDFDNCTECFDGYELNEYNRCVKKLSEN